MSTSRIQAHGIEVLNILGYNIQAKQNEKRQ